MQLSIVNGDSWIVVQMQLSIVDALFRDSQSITTANLIQTRLLSSCSKIKGEWYWSWGQFRNEKHICFSIFLYSIFLYFCEVKPISVFFSEVLFCVFQCFFSAKVCRLRVASLVTTRVGRSAWREGKPKIGIEIQNRNTHVQTNKKINFSAPFCILSFASKSISAEKMRQVVSWMHWKIMLHSFIFFFCIFYQLNASKNDAALFVALYLFFTVIILSASLCLVNCPYLHMCMYIETWWWTTLIWKCWWRCCWL